MDAAPPTPRRNPGMTPKAQEEDQTELKVSPNTTCSVDTDTQEAARPGCYVDVAPPGIIQLDSHPSGDNLNLTAGEPVSNQQDDDITIIDNILYEKLPVL